MLPNIDRSYCVEFKKTYRIPTYKVRPVGRAEEIVHLAYLDVCRTMRGIDIYQSHSFRQGAVAFINELMTLQPSNQTDFDLLHHRGCQRCLNSPGRTAIYYGQAQKLINMSTKYLYNEYALFGNSSISFPDNNVEYLFHLPIDNQMRLALVRGYGFKDPTPLPWSQWSYDEYFALQTELRSRIRNNYKPLEIDYIGWNKQHQSLANAIWPKS